MTAPAGKGPAITADTLAAATADQDSVLALARELIAIPSRGGIDDYSPILTRTDDWLRDHRLPVRVLHDHTGLAVGLASDIHGTRPGPRWVLNACLDTAPYGDETAWTHHPTDPVVADGWCWGRGSADSKTAAAIFCHIGARVAAVREHLTGTLALLFDVDEHSGEFGGAKTYFRKPDVRNDIAGVMIGYAGSDRIVVGGRGIHRARVHIHGIASHSGGSTTTPNAITKAAELITHLADIELPAGDPGFPLPGKITVTAITGGNGYSTTPDLCSLNIDIRTTPTFDDTAAAAVLREAIARLDHRWPTTAPTVVDTIQQWPPYARPDSQPATALFAAAESLGLTVTPKIAGPSNIGNLLAGMGIPATAGFGVDKIGEHATDERIRIATIPTTQAAYHHASLTLLAYQPDTPSTEPLNHSGVAERRT